MFDPRGYDEEWAAAMAALRSGEFASPHEPEPEPGPEAGPEPGWCEPEELLAVASDPAREALVDQFSHAAVQIARWQAVQARVLAAATDLALGAGTAGSEAELSVRDVAADLALAVGVSDRTVQRHMNDAVVLRDRFPAVLDVVAGGRLSRFAAQVIADEGTHLEDDAVRAHYERLILERALGLSAPRLRAAARAIAERLLPTTLAERHARARRARRVVLRDLDDGMSEFYAVLPTVPAHAMFDRVTQLSRRLHEVERDIESASSRDMARADAEPAGPPRTLDEIRADVLSDIVLTGHSTLSGIDRDGGDGIDTIRATVQITIPVQTLLGDDARPAILNGRVPVDPATARRLAGAATLWDRVLTDPITGDVRAVDRRFPTEAQRRFLRARDEHCRFPGCRIPVQRCDVDHTIDHQHGGPTAVENLAHLCRRHHVLKHQTAWTAVQGDRGDLSWTSPTGRVHLDQPPPRVRFVADDPPPW